MHQLREPIAIKNTTFEIADDTRKDYANQQIITYIKQRNLPLAVGVFSTIIPHINGVIDESGETYLA